MKHYAWSRLTHLQVGRFAEYFVKMEFTLYGFEVFTSEVDDRGIDFIVRHGNSGFLEIQVKAVRGWNYIFMPKDKFPLRKDRYAAVVILMENEAPNLYLIPATAWNTPNALLVGRDYEGRQSAPEWGLNVSRKNQPLLSEYDFGTVVTAITGSAGGRMA